MNYFLAGLFSPEPNAHVIAYGPFKKARAFNNPIGNCNVTHNAIGQNDGHRALAHLLAAHSPRDTKASKRANFFSARTLDKVKEYKMIEYDNQ